VCAEPDHGDAVPEIVHRCYQSKVISFDIEDDTRSSDDACRSKLSLQIGGTFPVSANCLFVPGIKLFLDNLAILVLDPAGDERVQGTPGDYSHID